MKKTYFESNIANLESGDMGESWKFENYEDAEKKSRELFKCYAHDVKGMPSFQKRKYLGYSAFVEKIETDEDGDFLRSEIIFETETIKEFFEKNNEN